MKKKVLLIANNSGGLYQFRKELIEEMISRGMEVYASIPRDDHFEDLESLKIKIIETAVDRRGMNPLKDFKLLLNYFKIIKEVKPNQIVTYTIKPNIYGGIVARLKKIPYAINITGLGTTFQNEGLLKTFIVLCYKVTCKKAKVVFFENSGNAQIFRKNKIVEENQICILNGAGVNLEKFSLVEYPKQEEKLHFLFMGRIMKEKGVDELFGVMERLHKENENIILDVLGHMEEGYEERIKDLSEQGVIVYHGHQADVRPFIANSHCFVLPSYHEGMANTLLEAGAMGRPLITSKIHGCMEAVSDMQSGYLVTVKNEEILYEKMKQFIGLSWNEKKEMGRKSREWIESRFDKKKVIEKTIARL